MLTKPISPPNYKFPLGWHSILHDFAQEILTVEYWYGEVVTCLAVEQKSESTRLRVFLISEAPWEIREEASDVLDQIRHRIHERAEATCCICGNPAHVSMVSNCGQHSHSQTVPYAELAPLMNPAWDFEDFRRLVEGASGEDLVREMASNQKQMDAATAFLKTHDAPKISQLLAQAHSIRAICAMESVLPR